MREFLQGATYPRRFISVFYLENFMVIWIDLLGCGSTRRMKRYSQLPVSFLRVPDGLYRLMGHKGRATILSVELPHRGA